MMWVARELDYEILEMIKEYPNLNDIQEPNVYVKKLPEDNPNNYVVLFNRNGKWFSIFSAGYEDMLADIINSIKKGDVECIDMLGDVVK